MTGKAVAATAPVPIAVLASGRGSNFDAIQGAIATGKLGARVVAVVSDKPEAAVLKKAEAAGIPAIAVPLAKKAGESDAQSRSRHEAQIFERLEAFAPRFLVLAGYMRILGPRLLTPYAAPDAPYFRIVNIHPSLLPAFPGTHSYARAFTHGVKMTGVSVHLVDDGLDSGPICAQEAFDISDCGSVAEVEARGLAIEHRLYPATLEWIFQERFSIEERNGRYCVRAN